MTGKIPNVTSVWANELGTALKDVLRGKKSGVVNIRFSNARGGLLLTDAGHEAVESTVSASGFWNVEAQLDGKKLLLVCSKFQGETIIDLTHSGTELTISSGSFTVRLPLRGAAGKKKVVTKPIVPQAHIGPLQVIEMGGGKVRIMQHKRDSEVWKILEAHESAKQKK